MSKSFSELYRTILSVLSAENDAGMMQHARTEALRSPDTSRKTGCVIQFPNGYIAAHNTFPAGVEVTPGRLERPAKYTFTEHAERMAIYHAARFGHKTLDTKMYLTWYPCADCARAIVQAGIAELICFEPDWSEARYGFEDARTILKEGGVDVRYYTA